MANIRNFNVTVPATSGEVAEALREASRTDTPIVLRGVPDATDINPDPAEELIEFEVEVTRNYPDGTIGVIGETATRDTVRLVTPQEADLPATLSVISEP